MREGIIAFFDGIVAATDDISKNFKYHRRNVVIKNYPLEFFTGIRAKKESTNNYKIIYAGGLTPERGITQIVQAMEFLGNNAKLILCGRFSPESYKKEIRSLRGFRSVEYKGFVNYKNIPELLFQSDAGIVNLLPEQCYVGGIPIKLFEYMAAGLPVIASNFPLWKEIVEGSKCGICVDPLAPEKIAEAINYLMEHPDEAKKMGENGRKVVLEKYNWELESKKLLKIYEELLR